MRALLDARSWRAYLVVATMAATLLGWSLAARDANATTIGGFTCGVIPSGQWCLYNVRHSYFFAQATYPGSGSVYVCEKTIYDSTGGDHQVACGYSYVDASFPPVSYLKPLAGNFSGSNHTVNGDAAY